ncbi:MAG: ATP-binding protein [Candidatus Woesearchaeota archaeon]|jgi:hypothetical protein|nr:ATP-binding protein [Candidatus Woesearchaeota archaeon]MDP7198239.1 ATP-binding protein [Candidatus Woesearchaeota archaeon]MDP7467075.1 ATP-binding protein [Candidatus Woesearchaeota archaeon]MDP7646743.1 ATP-binding protein [Candidatus Woesearchaeota archaeon]
MSKVILYDPDQDLTDLAIDAVEIVRTENSRQLKQLIAANGVECVLTPAMGESASWRAPERMEGQVHVDIPTFYITNTDTARQFADQGILLEDIETLPERIAQARQSPLKLIRDYGFAFEADSQGLTEVLMGQFAEPLLCFRELVQNSVDAGASAINIETGYDIERELLRVNVLDDGAGMSKENVGVYLTLFDSTKDTEIDTIGCMGAGKVFAHALGLENQIVTTGDGESGHQLTFNSDLSGEIAEIEPYQGTDVELLLPLKRYKARAFNKKLFEVVQQWCKYVKTPIYVNGESINRPFDISGDHKLRISEPGLEAVVALTGIGRSELVRGGIMLDPSAELYDYDEKGHVLGLFSSLIDAKEFDFPISRNGVVQNSNYERVCRVVKKATVKHFTEVFRQHAESKSQARLSKDARSFYFHVQANYGYNAITEEQSEMVDNLPIYELADRTWTSRQALRECSQDGKQIYFTNKGLSPTELSTFKKRGLPVLRSPHSLVENHLFEGMKSLDIGYFTGESISRFGGIDFNNISGLLREGFVSKMYGSSSGGGGWATSDTSTGFDNPFRFDRLRLCGADFTTLEGEPDQTRLLQSNYQHRMTYVTFNVNHPFIQRMEKLADCNANLASYFVACELIKSKQVFNNVSDKIRESEMLRVGMKVMRNA